MFHCLAGAQVTSTSIRRRLLSKLCGPRFGGKGGDLKRYAGPRGPRSRVITMYRGKSETALRSPEALKAK
jgi:hypothetical protein